MAAQPWAHPGGHPKQLCVWDGSTSEIASCQAPPWGGLPAAVDNRCQGGRESPAPCAHRLPSGQQEGARKAPPRCASGRDSRSLAGAGSQPGGWRCGQQSCPQAAWLKPGWDRGPEGWKWRVYRAAPLMLGGGHGSKEHGGTREEMANCNRDTLEGTVSQLQQEDGQGSCHPSCPRGRYRWVMGQLCMQGIWGSKERGAERLGSSHEAG